LLPCGDKAATGHGTVDQLERGAELYDPAKLTSRKGKSVTLRDRRFANPKDADVRAPLARILGVPDAKPLAPHELLLLRL